MKEELISLLNHQTLNITDQSENKWKVVEASDIQDIIDKSREGLHGVYCTYDGDDKLISIHRTKEGAEKNKKSQTDYSQEYYHVDRVVVWE